FLLPSKPTVNLLIIPQVTTLNGVTGVYSIINKARSILDNHHYMNIQVYFIDFIALIFELVMFIILNIFKILNYGITLLYIFLITLINEFPNCALALMKDTSHYVVCETDHFLLNESFLLCSSFCSMCLSDFECLKCFIYYFVNETYSCEKTTYLKVCAIIGNLCNYGCEMCDDLYSLNNNMQCVPCSSISEHCAVCDKYLYRCKKCQTSFYLSESKHVNSNVAFCVETNGEFCSKCSFWSKASSEQLNQYQNIPLWWVILLIIITDIIFITFISLFAAFVL
ncbi:hypothetical protein EIN_193170, partial [Entamoeba invadens IP1]